MKDTDVCSCVHEIARSFSRLREREAEHELAEIYQTSLMSALIDGVYDGSMSIAELLEHGDFGLGTFNDLDGELVAFDSEVHQLREDGSARVASMDQRTPFAVVTQFRPTMRGELTTALDKRDVQDLIDELVRSPNLFCAFRIDGRFERVETRTVPRQTKPYRPMLQAIERQPVFEFRETTGTLVGFRCPPYVQGINVAGFHVHYITDDRRGGGHVLDYRLLEGKLEIAKISKLRIDLPRTESFQQATLHSEEMSQAIEAAEG
ncbi:acetolactate decarboxylase [Paraburkholderia silviterrae]|uniref:Alpha-acetolactate decarboxylase n=2 Tax=Paraburkholderia silviterrae TaxID=2528715 RepID=A0A4R5M6H2_9BURK|nr:acetolactate decarboxylase [Paraburkholderia silviterrae]TDG21729.1 acetolactate decarboxylase [Paraburkholderia silviterrae]